MKKLSLVLLIIISAVITNAQGVGIGTITPKAAFNVAENKTVLFGKDTVAAGTKLMWIPSKHAFRAGVTGPVTAVGNGEYDFGDAAIWNYDSLGYFSFAGGFNNLAKGNSTTSFGSGNQSTGDFSETFGLNNRSAGRFSFAAGIGNIASQDGSMAFGQSNKALGLNSTAFGSSAEATGASSFAAGKLVKAAGNYSAAMGYTNQVNGAYATVMGYQNFANSINSVVLGRFNDTLSSSNPDTWLNTDPLFIIGNGSSNISRSNALTVLKNGKSGFGTTTPSGLIHSKYNSSHGNPQLMLEEIGNDYSRISFSNQNIGYWDIEGYTQGPFQSNDLAHFNFYFSLNDYILSLRGNGNAILTGTLYQNSDEHLKKNIFPIKNALSKLMQLNGYNYQWKDTARGKDEQIGLLAQEVEKQFPQLVTTDDSGKKSVAYGNMVPVLLQAIKEQQQQIDELKKLVEAKLK